MALVINSTPGNKDQEGSNPLIAKAPTLSIARRPMDLLRKDREI